MSNLRAVPALGPLVFVLAGLAATTACSGGTQSTGSENHDAGRDTGPEKTDGGAGDAGPDIHLTLITEPDQGMTPVYNFISSAKKSIDMTMYELKDTMITSLLTTAATNGVTVRVILDQNLEKHENTTAYNALAAGKVQVHWADTTYSATHQKTITIEGTTSAIMSLNLASEYYATTRDFAVITTDAADVSAIETTFNADFASTAITPPNGDDLVWSPTNSQASLVALINGAKSSLLIENEEMSYSVIVDALTAAASRGVDVRIAMTASASWDASFMSLTAAGAKVVTYASNASLYIHAKVIVADYGKTGASVFIGSENFSDASLTRNRELGIVTKDAAIMKAVNGTLTSDFNGGTAFQ